MSENQGSEDRAEVTGKNLSGKLRADQKRNDELQYHGNGVPHDPHNATRQRIVSNDPEAGDLNQVDGSSDAPFNKTYGRQE
jgi:hypothetical protein